MEACWRTYAFPMHVSSHSVIQLAVHLENEERLMYVRGMEADAVRRPPRSTLLGAFQLYATSLEARKYKYEELPEHYKYNQR